MNFQFHNIQLRFLNLTIKVRSRNINDIIWLKEFFSPQWESKDTSIHDCEINFLNDGNYFNNLLEKEPLSKTEIKGFILGKRIVKFIWWQSSENKETLFDKEFNVFYIVSRDKKEVSIVAHPGKSIGSRTALMRVIREYAMNYSRSTSDHFIHSSAFSYEGKGIIIAGPKNSGKTSLLIYFLLNLPSYFISNDRVLVCLNNNQPRIFGMPTIVTVSKDTLSMFPQLKTDFSKYNFHHRYTIDEILERKCIPYKLEQKEYTLSPRQFCKLLDVKSSPCSKLAVVLFPHIRRKRGYINLKTLSSEEALERLREAQLSKTISTSQSIFNLNMHNHHLLNNKLSYEDFAYRIASQILCLDCYLGLQAYQWNFSQDIIREILASNK